MSSSSPYRADIDGLRTIAILLVCAYHFNLLPTGKSGFIGVDLFFVISGFLITRIIVNEIERGRFRLRDFYARRVRRLYPALLTTLALYLVAGYFLFLPPLFKELAIETIASAFYVINLFLWQNVNYFGFQAESKPLLHMWSLAIEEQFYLFYPLLLVVLMRWLRGGRLLMAVTVAMLASFALNLAAVDWKPQATFYLLPTRAWELLGGGVVALFLRDRTVALPRGVTLAAGPVAIGLLVLAMMLHSPTTAFPGWFAALPVLSGMLFLIGGTQASAPVTRALSLPPMVWIGKISYPLYLVHWPIIIILRDWMQDFSLGWRWSGFVAAVLLAWAIWAWIEEPIRTRRWLARPVSAGAIALAVQGAILVFAAAVWFAQGGSGRLPPDAVRVLAYAQDYPRQFGKCDYFATGRDLKCRLGDPEAPLDAVVIGDSHSFALSGALDLWLKAEGQAVALAYANGCLPVPGFGDGRCRAYTRDIIARITRTPELRTVYLVSSWKQPYSGDGAWYDGVYLYGAEGRAAFARYLDKTVSDLVAAGKQVVLIEPMYFPGADVPEALARQIIFGQERQIDMSKAAYDAHFAHLLQTFEALTRPGVRHVSLIEELCASGTCPAIWEGRPAFADSNHIANSMGPYFARVLAQKLD